MTTRFFQTGIVCLLLLATACGHKSRNAAAGEPPVSETPGVYPETQKITVFLFDGLDTHMVIPGVWQDAVSIARNKKPDRGIYAQYDILFTGKSGREHEPIGAIYVFTKAQWDAFPKEWKGEYVQLNAPDTYLYFYKGIQSNPYDTQTGLGKEFDARFITMPDAAKKIIIEQ